MSYFKQHLFFCTNLRQNGKRCCGAFLAEELRDYTKQSLKKLGLHKPGQYRVNSASCLDRCTEGPVLVIYPEGVWYTYKDHKDIDEIIQQHLLKAQVVTRLLLPPPIIQEMG